MPTGDFPPPEGMIWTDAAGYVPAGSPTPMTAPNPTPDARPDAAGDQGLREIRFSQAYGYGCSRFEVFEVAE